MLSPDTVLQSRYRIVRQLGQGGMGTVYEAVDQRLNTIVALKESHFTEEKLSKQFEREAQLLARLRHPAMTRVIDHFTEGDGQFLVMDYISGEDLWEKIQQRNNAFPVDEVLQWADQLLDALEYLHTQDPPIIHRDIKPQNLKLTARNQIILLDFGLAKGFVGHKSKGGTSSIFGFTPNYAPLEQIQGEGTDARSDLYSFAAALYHLMTGAMPPDAVKRVKALANGESDPLRSANAINPKVTSELSDVLKKAMSIEQSGRYSSAIEMRDSLIRAISNIKTIDGNPESEIPTVYQGVREFIKNDKEYLRWLEDHPKGFVVNTTKEKNPAYMILHKSNCTMIGKKMSVQRGGFTERDYIKVCSETGGELEEWVKQQGRKDGSFSLKCSICKPTEGHARNPTEYTLENVPSAIKFLKVNRDAAQQVLLDIEKRGRISTRELKTPLQKKLALRLALVELLICDNLAWGYGKLRHYRINPNPPSESLKILHE